MSWEQAPNVPGTEGGPEALPHPQTWISHSVPVWCWVLGTGRGVVSQAMGHRGGGCIGHLSLGGGAKMLVKSHSCSPSSLLGWWTGFWFLQGLVCVSRTPGSEPGLEAGIRCL